MLRLIVLVILTAAVVAFGVANGQHVPLSFVLGEPLLVRQIFLLLSAAAIGVVGTLLAQQYLKIARRREREQLRLSVREAKAVRRWRDDDEPREVIDVSVRRGKAGRKRKRKTPREIAAGAPRRPSRALRSAMPAAAPTAPRTPRPGRVRRRMDELGEAEE